MLCECPVAEIICRKKQNYLLKIGVEAEVFAKDSFIWNGTLKNVKKAEWAWVGKMLL